MTATTRDTVTPQRVARIIWRRKLICIAVAAIIVAGGAGWLLTRPKVYQSTSVVALLPVASNAGVLPNYPNLIASLIPTYVQLVSSPVLLDQVAATVPFHITELQLATEVHSESMSSAAVISIVVNDANAVRAQEIAVAATTAFVARLRGNNVVVPQIYGRPVVPTEPYAPNVKLILGVLSVLALICGAAAGLAVDRLRSPVAPEAIASSGGQAPSPAGASSPDGGSSAGGTAASDGAAVTGAAVAGGTQPLHPGEPPAN